MLYKLYYFNLRARGELTRLIFAYKGQQFEDFRVKSTDWPALKPQMPTFKLPVLEINDGCVITRLTQSKAIARFLANKFHIAGETELDRAKGDEIVDYITEMFDFQSRASHHEKDKARQAADFERLNKTIRPLQSDFFEKTLKQNKSGFLVGRSVTWADLALMNYWDFVEAEAKEPLFDKYQLVKTHDKRIRQVPQIAEWLQNRPVTKF